LFGSESEVAASDVPLTNAGLKLFAIFGGGVATGEQIAYLIEMNVGEHATYTRLQVFFEEVDAPDAVMAGVEKDAMRMVASEAATLTGRMRRGKWDKADATDLTTLPHSDRRSPFPAHRRIIEEAAVKVLRGDLEGSMRHHTCAITSRLLLGLYQIIIP
jgi:hypothetical protein